MAATHPTLKRLEISFEQPRKSRGWIFIHTKVDNQAKTIWATDYDLPFENLIVFFEHVITAELPHEFEVDEEGRFARFVAKPHPNTDLFDFILDNGTSVSSPSQVFIEGTFVRRDFVAEFLDKFQNFLTMGYRHEDWAPGIQDLRDLSLDKLKTALR